MYQDMYVSGGMCLSFDDFAWRVFGCHLYVPARQGVFVVVKFHLHTNMLGKVKPHRQTFYLLKHKGRCCPFKFSPICIY